MSQTCCIDGMADAVLRELRRPSAAPPAIGEDLINAIVDAMVQANIDLSTVTAEKMKCLIGGLLRPAARRPRRAADPQLAVL